MLGILFPAMVRLNKDNFIQLLCSLQLQSSTASKLVLWNVGDEDVTNNED